MKIVFSHSVKRKKYYLFILVILVARSHEPLHGKEKATLVRECLLVKFEYFYQMQLVVRYSMMKSIKVQILFLLGSIFKSS